MSEPLPYSYFGLSKDEIELVQAWEQQLPPMISRKRAEWFTGGLVTRKRLSEADSAGTGPVDPIRVGKCVSYWTRHLLAWLATSRGINQMRTLSPAQGIAKPSQAEAAGQRPAL